jgi:hypothetical protein
MERSHSRLAHATVFVCPTAIPESFRRRCARPGRSAGQHAAERAGGQSSMVSVKATREEPSTAPLAGVRSDSYSSTSSRH